MRILNYQTPQPRESTHEFRISGLRRFATLLACCLAGPAVWSILRITAERYNWFCQFIYWIFGYPLIFLAILIHLVGVTLAWRLMRQSLRSPPDSVGASICFVVLMLNLTLSGLTIAWAFPRIYP